VPGDLDVGLAAVSVNIDVDALDLDLYLVVVAAHVVNDCLLGEWIFERVCGEGHGW
jgi:hypothetical protein